MSQIQSIDTKLLAYFRQQPYTRSYKATETLAYRVGGLRKGKPHVYWHSKTFTFPDFHSSLNYLPQLSLF